MRRIAVILALLCAGAGAMAQPNRPPEVIQPQDQIELAIGESRTLQFSGPFQRAGTATEGIARILPQSDRTLTVSGVGPGQTAMFVHGTQGDVIYSAIVIVAPSGGHLVKFYGRDTKDFTGYYCSETGCGRANLDKTLANGGRDPDEPTAQAVTVTRPLEGGGAVSTTNQYRR
jgi:hypothetical protein